MSAPPPELDVLRCPSCHGTFTPPRGCCARCGQRALTPGRLPAQGVVIAVTELAVPTGGRPAPHRLVLVELAEGLRVLANGNAPAIGATVPLAREGLGYRIP
jgi:uncharacterized OB-fold protein